MSLRRTWILGLLLGIPLLLASNSAVPNEVAAPAAAPAEASASTSSGEALEQTAAKARALLLKSEDRSSNCVADPKVLEDLAARQAALDQREQGLKGREEELQKKEKVLQEQVAKMEDLQKALNQKRVEFNEQQGQQVTKLVETLERMSPKASAKMMNEVEESLAVEAMTRMSTDKLAKILSNLEPAKSSRLSELMTLGRSSERAPARASAQNPGANAGSSGSSKAEGQK